MAQQGNTQYIDHRSKTLQSQRMQPVQERPPLPVMPSSQNINEAAKAVVGSIITNPAPKKYAQGGEVHGPGTSTSDSIPAKLSDGEIVLNAGAAKQLKSIFKKMGMTVDGFNAKFAPKKAETIVKNGTLNAAGGIDYQQTINNTTGINDRVGGFRPASKEALDFTAQQGAQDARFVSAAADQTAAVNTASGAASQAAGAGIKNTAIKLARGIGTGAAIAAGDAYNNYKIGDDVKNGAFTDKTSKLQDAGTAARLLAKNIVFDPVAFKTLPIFNQGVTDTAQRRVKDAYDYFTQSPDNKKLAMNPVTTSDKQEQVAQTTDLGTAPIANVASLQAASQAKAQADTKAAQEALANKNAQDELQGGVYGSSATVNQSMKPYAANGLQAGDANTLDVNNGVGGTGRVQIAPRADGDTSTQNLRPSLTQEQQNSLQHTLNLNADPGFQARQAEQAKIVDDRYKWARDQRNISKLAPQQRVEAEIEQDKLETETEATNQQAIANSIAKQREMRREDTKDNRDTKKDEDNKAFDEYFNRLLVSKLPENRKILDDYLRQNFGEKYLKMLAKNPEIGAQ